MIAGTVKNINVVDIPARVDVRMAGGDARVISSALWQGTLPRGSTQTVDVRRKKKRDLEARELPLPLCRLEASWSVRGAGLGFRLARTLP